LEQLDGAWQRHDLAGQFHKKLCMARTEAFDGRVVDRPAKLAKELMGEEAAAQPALAKPGGRSHLNRLAKAKFNRM
jgi:hypothetical protein